MCEYIRDEKLGSRAVIRVEPENSASVRVAQKSGFTHVRDFTSAADTQPYGAPFILSLYVRDL